MSATYNGRPAAWDGVHPLDWFRLIGDAEEFRRRTGWGLGGVWGLIHSRDYHAARARMDEALAHVEDIVARRSALKPT